VRFNSPALHEEASRVLEAGGHALALEQAHLETPDGRGRGAGGAISATAERLARIDVAAAWPSGRAKAAGSARLSTNALPGDRGRPPPGGRARAGRLGRAVRRQRLLPRAPPTACG
jgi:DNA mismatch repair protein MutS